MKRVLFAGVIGVMLLAGCATKSSTYYANKLQLVDPPMPQGTKISIDSFMTDMMSQVQNAPTPQAADDIVARISYAQRIFSSFNPSRFPNPQGAQAGVNCLTWIEHAAKIKRQQLIDGDTTDSNGEVRRHLDVARSFGS